jgi:uncharacterized protein (TIGR03435 family)
MQTTILASLLLTGRIAVFGQFNPPATTAPAAQTAGAATAPPAFDNAPAAAPSPFRAVQQDLGLRLDQKKMTVELIVVDRLEKVPAEN